MLRSKLLLFLLSGALIFASCGDSGTDPNNGNGGGNGDGNGNGDGDETPEETVEPSASINNPSDGATLEDEITFVIGGESENGFDELRIYVGDEEVASVSDPSLPYEHNITTYEFDNGNYDLSAELDPSGDGSTVEASVSTTFENYMVTLETDGFIESLRQRTDATYLFIADPQGNVLHDVELTAQSDGELQLLPPGQLDGSAPSTYSATIAREQSGALALTTDFGLEPWSRIYKEGTAPATGSMNQVTISLNNMSSQPDYTAFRTNTNDQHRAESENGSLQTTFSHQSAANDLLITHFSHPYQEQNTPVYHWEEGIDNPDQLEYNVGNDFTEMRTVNVSHSSNVAFSSYQYDMSVAANSWDSGFFSFPEFWQSGYDTNDSETAIGMYVPNEDHEYRTNITATDNADQNVWYEQQTTGNLPDNFVALDAEVQVLNRSLDDLSLEIQGGGFDNLWAYATSPGTGHRWGIYMPLSEDNTSVVFPKISGSLSSSVSNFNRSDFEIRYLTADEYENIDGYTEYLEAEYGSSNLELGDFQFKWWYIGNSQQKRAPQKQNHARDLKPRTIR